jgi:hypothetical protein
MYVYSTRTGHQVTLLNKFCTVAIIFEAIRLCFITKQTIFIQSNTTQVYCNSNCTFICILHVSACTICQYKRRYIFIFYLPLYGFCVDMPEDGLSTGRNM